MIIYYSLKVNKFSKNYITKYEDTENFDIRYCPHCNSNELIKWGSYVRNVIYYKNGKKYEEVIKIKRIRCNNCKKTQSIIPNFLVPYKVHTTEYITDAVKNRLVTNSTYNTTCEKYQVSRQLLKYWLECFEEHYTRISVTLGETKEKKIIRIISKSIYDFIYKYYCENRMVYMMYISSSPNRPILKWAPT